MFLKIIHTVHSKYKHIQSFSGIAGFTLIQVLVSIALLSLVVGLSSRAWVASQRAEHSLESSKGFENIQDSLFQALQTLVRSGIRRNNVPCLDLANEIAPGFWLQPSTKQLSEFRSQKPGSIGAKEWNELFDINFAAGTAPSESLSRCARPSFGTNGRFHFCLELQTQTNAPQNSIRRAPFGFVEVSFQLIDIQTGQNINCSSFRNITSKTAGASVTYLLYWASYLGNQLELKHKNGVFYVDKN